jgi:hypothetical protein
MRYTEVFGFKLEEIGQEGAESLETKMRSAGMPMEELPGPPIFAYGLPRERRVENGLRLVRGGVFGEKLGPPSTDPETVRALFDLLGASLDHTKAPPDPGTIQWDFPDAEPWHLVVANGDTRVEQGRAAHPTVTFQCRFEDWADVFAGRENALRLAARRRLRPSGDFRWLWRARRMFPK